MPDSSDNYQLPSWPPTKINREIWNAVMGSIAQRLTAREELEATFESLQATGIQATLDYIQVTVAPQIATIQASIELAQEQIDQIVIDGIAPNAAKLGGQLPAHYATASALALKADQSYVDQELLDFATATQILLDQKANATEIDNALEKRLRADMAQNWTRAERGQARANIDAGVLSGFRNKIINGNFDIWQRGVGAFTATGYTADRWGLLNGAGASNSLSRVATGANSIYYGGAQYALSWTRSVAGTNASRLVQKIEDVWTLAGKRLTISFWAASGVPTEIEAAFTQFFGTGGTPSASVTVPTQQFSLTGSPKKFTATFDVPSIAGKTLGTTDDDCLWFVLRRPHDSQNPTALVNITHVSVVEGDATAEEDPFSPRHPQQELALCQRYYETGVHLVGGYHVAANEIIQTSRFCVQKRTTPAMTGAALSSSNATAASAIAPIDASSYRASLVLNTSGGGSIDWSWTADAEL